MASTYPSLKKVITKSVRFFDEDTNEEYIKYIGTKGTKPANAVQCQCGGTLAWYSPAGSQAAESSGVPLRETTTETNGESL